MPIVPRGGILPIFPLGFQASLQCYLESPYSDLCLSVGLQMSWGRIVILDSKLGAKVFEFQVVELLSIIRYQCSWDSIPTYYGTPNEVAYCLLGDYC